MTPDPANLTTVKKSLIKSAGRIFAKAFMDDPFISYVFPDLEKRELKSVQYFRLLLQYVHCYGEIYTSSGEMRGVAAWLPSDQCGFSLWKTIRTGGLKTPFLIGLDAFKRLNLVVNHVMSVQERVAPENYMYLNALCVSPEYQGQGFSTKLLRPMFDRLDKEKRPCYMETQKSGLIPFYEKYGFQLIDEEPIPGTSLVNLAMLRKSDNA